MKKGHKAFTMHLGCHSMRLTTHCVIASVGQVLNQDEALIPSVAIWDTGAPETTISEELARELGLVPCGVGRTGTVAGESELTYYHADLLLPDGIALCGWRVAASKHLPMNRVLIGMDIIGMGDFAVTNTNGETVLSFRVPSDKVIDFAKPNESTPRKKSWFGIFRRIVE